MREFFLGGDGAVAPLWLWIGATRGGAMRGMGAVAPLVLWMGRQGGRDDEGDGRGRAHMNLEEMVGMKKERCRNLGDFGIS